MKAIFVESSNGYLAKGPDDNMSWTPLLDKKIFKLLTYVYGGICICSKRTYGLLPLKMRNDSNRTFICADRTGPRSLQHLNMVFPNAVLIGGPTFLKAAFDAGVIDTFIVTTVEKTIKNNSKYENPFLDILLTAGQIGEVEFEGLTVRLYSNTSYNISKWDTLNAK